MYFDCFYFHVCLSLNWIFQRWMGFLKSPCGFLPVEPLWNNSIFYALPVYLKMRKYELSELQRKFFQVQSYSTHNIMMKLGRASSPKKFRSEKRGLTRSVNSCWSIRRIRWVINDKVVNHAKIPKQFVFKIEIVLWKWLYKTKFSWTFRNWRLARYQRRQNIIFSNLEITSLLP